MSSCLSALLLGGLVWGCGVSLAPETVIEKPTTYVDGNEGVDVAAIETGRRLELESANIQLGPVFAKKAWVEPKEPTVNDVLVAEAELEPPVDRLTRLKYSWYVNDRKVSGVTAARFPCQGRFVRGDRVHVVVEATDAEQRSVETRSLAVVVGNAMPKIVTDASSAYGLEGITLEAEDPDRDRLSWSVLDGPPGVSISPSGRIRVRQIDLKEAYDGEVVFAATDPGGLRAELHVPVKINAAREAKIEEKKVERVLHRNDMTDQDYARHSLEEVKNIEKMSPEELERYLDKQLEGAR